MKTYLDYTDTIPSANATKPLFLESVKQGVQGFVDVFNTVESFISLYDLDLASGQQLDVIGEWVGISRKISIPIDAYFSLDIEELGLDRGVLKGPFDPDEGLTSVDDTTYRLLIRSKIAGNHWDGTMESAQSIIASIYASYPLSKIFVIDNYDMTMDIGVSGELPSSVFLSLLQQKYIFLKPGGVRISNVFVTSDSGSPLFGLDVNNSYIGGLGFGALAI